MSERRTQVHVQHRPTKTRRCKLLNIVRSSAYYRADPVSSDDLKLMRLIDEIHLRLPFYGSRRVHDELAVQGYVINRKRIQRLMRRWVFEHCIHECEQASRARGTKSIPLCH